MLYGLLKTMRPRQWVKNGFVFVPLLFDGLISAERIINTLLAFLLLCLVSGAVYLMNDLADIESDRSHPKKKFRPLPSGELNPSVARVAAVAFSVLGIALGFLLAVPLGIVLLVYFVSQIAYSFWLKHVVLLDIGIVSLGFILRIAAGVTVIEVERFSPWLYLFGGFLALFMILGKRRHELTLLNTGAGKHRAVLEEYSVPMLDIMITIVTTCAIVSYSLYTFLSEGLPDNDLMMATIPFLLYGMFRYLYLIHIKEEGGAPEEILLRDRPSQVNLVIWAAIVITVIYLLP
ncbi:MAG: decaprenyl-phosphate phosphoribosyltransferase [Candidatus Promineifilaceae bacterium]